MNAVEELSVVRSDPVSSPRCKKHLVGLFWRLARRQATVLALVFCFRDQSVILPRQCSDGIAELEALRRALYRAHDVLLHHSKGEHGFRYFACVQKLADLDELLSEAILTIAMFAPISQSLLLQRVELHVRIRALLPRLYVLYQETLSQFVHLLLKREVCL